MTQAPSIKEALELKPCPFCGGPAGCVAFEFVTCLSAQPLGEDICPGKQIKAPVDRDEPTYSTAWNTRATLQPSGERRDAIARMLKSRIGSGRTVTVGPGLYDDVSEAADAILASGLMQDEAAIRADEREKCAEIADLRYEPVATEIAAAIRSARDGGEG